MKKDRILYFILGLLLASTTAYAAYKYKANEVEYTPENENWKVDNVESAIDDLNKILKPIELELGKTYEMGGYEWVAAEELDGGYVMQSTGMTSGAWPGYKLTGNYDGTKSYGNANTVYTNNIDGDNIANYDNITSEFYEAWKNRELTSASYGKGLFLVSNEKCGNSTIPSTSSATVGSGNYITALEIAAKNRDDYGSNQTSSGSTWIGTFFNTQSAAFIFHDQPTLIYYGTSSTYGGEQSRDLYVIAPAFNLDASKVYLDGTEIKKK